MAVFHPQLNLKLPKEGKEGPAIESNLTNLQHGFNSSH